MRRRHARCPHPARAPTDDEQVVVILGHGRAHSFNVSSVARRRGRDQRLTWPPSPERAPHQIGGRGIEILPALLRRLGHFRSEEHTSELQSLMRISYAVFCLKKK